MTTNKQSKMTNWMRLEIVLSYTKMKFLENNKVNRHTRIDLNEYIDLIRKSHVELFKEGKE